LFSIDNIKLPAKIICLTEESVETLFALNMSHCIIGVSAFVKRPSAACDLPKVSFFTTSNIDKIVSMNADLILGYSDIQKDIARELIERGQNVFISNHRTIGETLDYIYTLGTLVGKEQEARAYVGELIDKVKEVKLKASELKIRPRVYFEEWDDPMISAIQWVSECIEISGGINIFKSNANGFLAKERFVEASDVISFNPDIIIGCWCGKKVKIESIKSREGWDQINAVKNNQVFEVEPEIFLQPGPAPILDGLDILLKIFNDFSKL
jgi:iron complex transport system substrate-binding protein